MTAVVLVGIALVVPLGAGWTWHDFVDSYTLTNAVVGSSLTASGAVITWFRPRNAVGVLLMAAGAAHLVSGALAPLAGFGASAGWPGSLVSGLGIVVSTSWTLGLPSLFMLALLLFPDGRLLSPRWRWCAWLIVAMAAWGLAATPALAIIDPAPGGAGTLTSTVTAIRSLLDAVTTVSVIIALALRYRRGDERVRRQLLWLILAVIAMLLFNAQRWITGDGPILLLLSTLFIPIAVAIAIIRYRLLDIRLMLSHTLLYGVLITLAIAAYAGIVAALSLVVPAEADRAIAASAAVAVAVAFDPLRALLQRTISRAFYGTRDDPAATAARLQAGLGAQAGIADALGRLRAALHVPRLELRSPDGTSTAAGRAEEEATVFTVPLGESAGGRLLVTLRPGERRLHETDRSTLQLIGPLLELLLRERELTARLREARAAAAEARERERELLHRELHDGLGPALTGLALQTDAARNLLGSDPARSGALLGQVRAGIGGALHEVRRVVYGLRPIALDERGLLGAIREYGDSAPSMRPRLVAAEPLPELSPAQELAAYRIVLEAIANAQRHSTGSQLDVDLRVADGALRIEVHDDGDPPPSFRPGVGIRSMSERAEELGGSLTAGPAGTGWTVRAELPLAGPEPVVPGPEQQPTRQR